MDTGTDVIACRVLIDTAKRMETYIRELVSREPSPSTITLMRAETRFNELEGILFAFALLSGHADEETRMDQVTGVAYKVGMLEGIDIDILDLYTKVAGMSTKRQGVQVGHNNVQNNVF